MKSIALLDQYVEERDELLTSIKSFLENDPIVKAAWMFGSYGRGDEDALSDFDLWVIVDDDTIQTLNAQPRMYTSQISKPVLFVEAPQNAPDAGAYLMTSYDASVAPHIVDWYWQPVSVAQIPGQVRLLFDNVSLVQNNQPIHSSTQAIREEGLEMPEHFVSFFWMMLMITAKHAARNPGAKTMELLPLLIEPLEKAQHYLGRNSLPLSKNIPTHQLPGEKIRLLYQLADQMVEMMASMAARGEAVPDQIIPGAYRYLDLIDLIIEK